MKYLVVLFFSLMILSCKQAKSENETTTDQEQVEIDKQISVKGEQVDYVSDSLTMKGYVAFNKNSEEKRPGVIIVHEWWGHNEYVRQRAHML